MRKNTTCESHTVTERLFCGFAIIGVAFLIGFIYCVTSNNTEGALFTGAVSAIAFVGCFVCPIHYFFDEKKITVVFLTRKQVILYSSIIKVICVGIFESFDNLPKYEIIYSLKYKGRSIVKNTDVPKSKKSKQIIEKYLYKKIS
ncbi:MAG: hypothetical protein IKJ24_00295 [Clostridia bacterium]|nr:hypothetical protein [Clostridia bacterium]